MEFVLGRFPPILQLQHQQRCRNWRPINLTFLSSLSGRLETPVTHVWLLISSSALEEVSIDDSDRDFGYEFDDAEDDDREYYDDIPDDEVEDDDEEDDCYLPPWLS